jgi:hypothetical protein
MQFFFSAIVLSAIMIGHTSAQDTSVASVKEAFEGANVSNPLVYALSFQDRDCES